MLICILFQPHLDLWDVAIVHTRAVKARPIGEHNSGNTLSIRHNLRIMGRILRIKLLLYVQHIQKYQEHNYLMHF